MDVTIQELQATNINLNCLSDKYLLVDTNFLIDSLRKPTIYKEIIEKIASIHCSLISLDSVFYEFTQGSKSLEEYKKRVEFYEETIGTVIPIDSEIIGNVNNISKLLLKRSSQLSYVDCLLLATLMRFEHSLFLLSKDRSDIPIKIFPIETTLVVDDNENNFFFSIYKFNKENYAKKLKELVKEI